MSKFEKRFSKAATGRRGSGFISWKRFNAMLRATGFLGQGQRMEKVTVEDKGITITTDKTGNQK